MEFLCTYRTQSVVFLLPCTLIAFSRNHRTTPSPLISLFQSKSTARFAKSSSSLFFLLISNASLCSLSSRVIKRLLFACNVFLAVLSESILSACSRHQKIKHPARIAKKQATIVTNLLSIASIPTKHQTSTRLCSILSCPFSSELS